MGKFVAKEKAMNKNKYLQALQTAKDIVKKDIPSSTNLITTAEELTDKVQDFKIKVLVIGEFSSGKTALMNRLLGINLLKEDVTPETAIATELVYDEKEGVDLVLSSGEAEHCSLADVPTPDPDTYLKYVYHLNNPVLKELSDYVLVDMPGFNSGVEAHNKALLQYIGQATAYLFVTNIESGCMTDSSVNFLNEIRSYSPYVGYVLTKCDKLSNENVQLTTENIRQHLQYLNGVEPDLVTTSAVDDEHLPEKLKRMIQSFKAKDMLQHCFDDEIVFLLDRCLSGLKLAKGAIAFDTSSIDREISRCERVKEALKTRFEQKKDQIHRDFQNQVSERIISDIRGSLMENVEILTSAAMQGPDSFKQCVNGIIRPRLIESTNEALGNFATNIVSDIGDLLEHTSDGMPDLSGKVDQLAELSRRSVESFKAHSGQWIKGLARVATKSMGAEKVLYKTITTTLAVVTNVIAPILELVLIFLPDILSFVSKYFERNKVQEQIENVAIPRLCGELAPKIKESMDSVQSSLMQEIEEKFQTEIEEQMKVLKQLQSSKKEKQEEMDGKIQALTQDIAKLEQVRSTFEVAQA